MGNLNLLADDQILIGANLSTISAFKAGKDIKIVKSIPVISDLINDDIERFSIDKLVMMLVRAGMDVRFEVN